MKIPVSKATIRAIARSVHRSKVEEERESKRGSETMLTDDERKQIDNFQDAVAALVDHYLVEGLDPETISEILHDEAAGDLYARRKELEAA